MNYQEAKRLAQAWTQGVDVNLEGWRSVMSVLLSQIDTLEKANAELTACLYKITREPPKTLADIIKDTQDKSSW